MILKAIGQSPQNIPILAYTFAPALSSQPVSTKAPAPYHVLIIGGVHGDETEGIVAAQAILGELAKNYPFSFVITVIPVFNPDGMLAKNRCNSRGVDLNRNMPTRDWSAHVAQPRYNPGPSAMSEPESVALVNYLDQNKVDYIISLHSWKPLLNTNGNCEPFASELSALTGYSVEPTIGYPTPGCLGTYSGLERNIPTLTYEIERGLAPQLVVEHHARALLKALHALEPK